MPAPPATSPGVPHRLAAPFRFPGVMPDSATADALGQATDAVVATLAKWNSLEADVQTTNSAVTLLTVLNGAFCDTTYFDAFPATWYMRNAAGARLRSTIHAGYLMDPRGAGSFTDSDGSVNTWAEYVALKAARLGGSPRDGVLLDGMGPEPMLIGGLVAAGGVGRPAPYNPQSGRDFTTAEYLATMWAVADGVREADVWCAANGLINGLAWETVGTSGLIEHADLVCADRWLRSPTAASLAFPTEARWLRDVGMLIDANLAGYRVAVTTRYWRTAEQDGLADAAWAAIVARWRRYAICSLMIGTRNGRTLLEFSALDSQQPWDETDDLYDIDLGAALDGPAAPVRSVEGYYLQRYASGLALMNPSPQAVVVSASPDGRTYTDAGASPIVYPHQLAARDGEIWLA